MMVKVYIATVFLGFSLCITSEVRAEASVDERISRLESQVSSLTNQLKQETEHMLEITTQMELITQRVGFPSDRRGNHSKDNSENGQMYGIQDIFLPNRRLSRSTEPNEVGFSVILGDSITNIPLHTTIKFDTVITRTGDTYDVTTGVFTCPTSGLYLFSVFIEPAKSSVESVVALKRDGIIFMDVIAEISSDDEDMSDGNVVLLSVNKGQHVWVETVENDNQSFWKTYTSFSGVLIHPHQN